MSTVLSGDRKGKGGLCMILSQAGGGLAIDGDAAYCASVGYDKCAPTPTGVRWLIQNSTFQVRPQVHPVVYVYELLKASLCSLCKNRS